MKKRLREVDEVRESIIEFWRAVLIMFTAFAAIVVYIFTSSALEWKHKQERLELLAQQKIAAKVGQVSVYAFVNNWGGINQDPTIQYRKAVKLEQGVEYEVGRKRYYDVSDEETNKLGFDHVRMDQSDEIDYILPVLTVQYSKFIHVRSSLDNSWMESGYTQKGAKTGEWLYTLPVKDEREISIEGDAWGEKTLTVTFPVNGIDLDVNIDSTDISDELRKYNYIVTEKLGEQYENVPAEYADRTRKVYTSHVLIEGWRTDQRDRRAGNSEKGLTPTPEVTVLVRIKHYGNWDLTKDEFESMRYKVSEFSSTRFNHDYSSRTTMTYVGMATST